MIRRLSYVHLLYGAVALLLAVQLLAVGGGRALHRSTIDELHRALAQYRESLALVGEVRAAYSQSRHLFERNQLMPRIEPLEVRAVFDGLSRQAQALGTEAEATLARRAYVGVHQYLALLESEERTSDSAQRLAAAVGRSLEELLAHLYRPHDELARDELKGDELKGAEAEMRRLFLRREVQAARELMRGFQHTDPPHGESIVTLLDQVAARLDQSRLVSGRDGRDFRGELLGLSRRLRAGIHAIYTSGTELQAMENEPLRLKLNRTFEESGVLLAEIATEIGNSIESEQATLIAALERRDRLFVGAMLFSVLVALGGVALLLRLLRRRVGELVVGARRIGEGDYQYPISLPGGDDLGRLARAFNRMGEKLLRKERNIHETLAQLEEARAELAEANRGLERRVAERTAELRAAVAELEAEVARREAAEKELVLAAKVVENVQEGIVITDSRNRIISINPAYTEITGFTEEEILGRDPGFAKSNRHGPEFYAQMWKQLWRDGHWRGEIWNRRKNGEVFPKLLSISLIKDERGEIGNCVAVFSDISKQKQSEERMEQLAFFDPLTRLPNRALFKERLERCRAGGERRGERFALLFVDLDHFKQVNDSLGHDAGDELLVEVARRMRQVVKRETDTVARVGGDEFTVILDPIAEDADASRIASELIAVVERPVRVKGREVAVGCSIGIALYPEDGDSLEGLTKNADVAMYHAKEQGRNNYQFYRGSLTAESHRRLELESALRLALPRNEFQVYYQPKWHGHNGRLAGFEALIRWFPRDGGMITPDRFIPLLEESRQIIEVGQWVLERSAAQARAWLDRYGRVVPIAVNVSARQLQEPDFLDRVREIKERFGLPDGALEAELTESAVMGDPIRAAEVISGLYEVGVPVAIDDFGTGYSSLGHLKRFRLQTLKVDRSFVRDITIDADDAAIVSAVISLAEQLGFEVVVEGVEEFEQLERVQQLFGDRIAPKFQGFLVSPPCPVERAERFITADEIVPARDSGRKGRRLEAVGEG